ncbi:MAG: 6-bladed beta-propeller [Prevotellaceae bacterium]|jgi:hypothetical protein|nr:6-bladed beta-propeller [Prevotellaceae bacterium]
MKQILYVFICSILFIACWHQKESVVAIEHIDMRTTEKIRFTDMFKDFRVIVPETSDNSLFGLEIQRIEHCKDRLYLLNRIGARKNILCFDSVGKFLFVIDRLGGGPEEYTYLEDFFIDTQNDNIVLKIESGWMFLDLNGKYLYSKKYASDEDNFPRYICEFNDSLYVGYQECMRVGNPDVIFLDRTTMQIKYGIKSDSLYAEFTPSLPIDGDGNTIFFYSRNDIIYDISSDISKKLPVCVVDMGEKYRKFKNSEPKEVSGESESSKIVQALIEHKFNIIRSFLCNKQYFAVSYIEFYPEVHPSDIYKQNGLDFFNYNVFYDRHTKKSYNTKYMNFDILNSFNPQKMSMLGSSDDGYFYAVINEYLDREQLSAIAKSPYLKKEIKQAILSMDELSNPLILMFK